MSFNNNASIEEQGFMRVTALKHGIMQDIFIKKKDICDCDGNSGDPSIVYIPGPKGEQGETGPQGLEGLIGNQGIAGSKGDPGEEGDLGLPGEDGPAGPSGNDGNDGRYFSIAAKYSTVEEMQANNSIEDGKLVIVLNPDGGSKVYLVSSGLNEVSLISEDDVIGFKYILTLPSKTDLQGIEGPQGPLGDRGPQGERGIDGVIGIKGELGPEGPQGPRGDQGTQGGKGPTGIAGENGPKGENGDKGATGDKGITGDPGVKGEIGDDGINPSFIVDNSEENTHILNITDINHSFKSPNLAIEPKIINKNNLVIGTLDEAGILKVDSSTTTVDVDGTVHSNITKTIVDTALKEGSKILIKTSDESLYDKPVTLTAGEIVLTSKMTNSGTCLFKTDATGKITITCETGVRDIYIYKFDIYEVIIGNDNTPPAAPSDLKVVSTESGDRKITWVDNIDDDQFVKSILIRKYRSVPLNYNDGILLIEETEKNFYSTNIFSDSIALNDGQDYIYAVYTLSKNGIWSAGITFRTTYNAIYGMIIHQEIADPSDRVEYFGINMYYTPLKVNLETHTVDYGSWKEFPLLKENKPWMVKNDGTPDYQLDENDYTKRADNGEPSDVNNIDYDGGAYSWIKKIYKHEYIEGTDRIVQFSFNKVNDDFEALGFIENKNGELVELEGIWLPMFYGSTDSSNRLRSVAGDTSMTKFVSYSDTMTKIKANGENHNAFGGLLIDSIVLLATMFSKSTNTQMSYGYGLSYTTSSTTNTDANYVPLEIKNKAEVAGQFYGSSDGLSYNTIFHSIVLGSYAYWYGDILSNMRYNSSQATKYTWYNVYRYYNDEKMTEYQYRLGNYNDNSYTYMKKFKEVSKNIIFYDYSGGNSNGAAVSDPNKPGYNSDIGTSSLLYYTDMTYYFVLGYNSMPILRFGGGATDLKNSYYYNFKDRIGLYALKIGADSGISVVAGVILPAPGTNPNTI